MGSFSAKGLGFVELLRNRIEIDDRAHSVGGDEQPLSLEEKALWIDHQLDPSKCAYNLARAFWTNESMPGPAVAAAFREVALRHAPLRTVFPTRDGEPLKKVLAEPASEFLEYDATGWSPEALAARLGDEANRPFSLQSGPLWRVVLFRRDDGTVLLFVIHHLIADMQSVAAVVAEFGARYTNTFELPRERTTRGVLSGIEPAERLARAEQYWTRQLAEPLPTLELPKDFPEVPSRTGCGRLLTSTWAGDLYDGVAAMTRAFRTTSFVVLLAGYAALLNRWSGQRDIIVGCPVSRRRHDRRGEVAGYQVNPLPLRIKVDGARDFRSLVENVHTVVRGALAHGGMPLVRLAGQGHSRQLYQTMLVLYRGLEEGNFAASVAEIENAPFRLGALECRVVPVERRACLMDLRLEIVDTGGTYRLRWEYATDSFAAATIRSIASSFETLMRSALENRDARVASLATLTPEEQHRIAHEWNSTAFTFPSRRAIHNLVEEQARRTPGRTAVVFEDQILSYAELDHRANQLARRLASLDVGPECFVGIRMERSLEAAIAFLAVLKAGAAFVPLDPSDPVERLMGCISQVGICLILSHGRSGAGLHGVRVIEVDRAEQWGENTAPLSVQVAPESAAYLIFTSGSTGQPKGVINTHAGIYNRLAWMQSEYPLESTDAVLQKTPFTFDVSVWEIFWPLMTGARMVLARPGGHRDPAYLARLIEHAGVTTLHFVPSMLREFLEWPETANLPSIRRVFSSGEELIRQLAETCLSRIVAPLYNLYGPTEAAIDVSYHRCAPAADARRIPIGRPIANTQLYILDTNLNLVPTGMPGELYIGGAGLARGYAKRSAATAERFVPDAFSGIAGRRLYRTGDLARRREEGAIEYLGRIDNQTKVAGVRIELEEIEAQILRHPGVRAAAARVVARHGARICCYFVPRNGVGPSPTELREFLAGRLARGMVPSWFVRLDALPLTASGKLDRKALPEPDAGDSAASGCVHADGSVESWLVSICSAVLGRTDLHADDAFIGAGGHSLDAIRVISRVHAETGIDLPVEALLGNQTLAAVARDIVERRAGMPLPPLPPRNPALTEIPLSYEQERLWILDQLLPGSTAYNVDYAVRIKGALETSLVERAIEAVLDCHEILRTTFALTASGPVQRVQPRAVLDFRYVDFESIASDSADEAIRREARMLAQTPFDLTRLPLARFRLVCTAPANHVLLVSIHHIVCDGWSLGPLLSDFLSIYSALEAGRPLALGPVRQYADYCLWQRKWMTGDVLQERLSYWTKRLDGLACAGIPTDRPRPAVQSFRGAELRMKISPDLLAKIETTAAASNATLFMTLLAAFAVLLHRWSGETDLAIATPVANRQHPDLEDVVGFFVNTLVLRLDLSGDPMFAELLARVRQTTLEAFDHSDTPFEKLIETLQPLRDLSRPPLFQSLFVFQNTPMPPPEGPLRFEPLHLDSGNVRYDLRLSIEPRADGLDAAFQYNSDLFERDSVERMMSQFQMLLDAIAAGTAQQVSAMPILTPAELHFWRDEWNRTETELDDTRLEALFLQQVSRDPEALAVVSADVRLSYGELAARSAAVAQTLIRADVRPGELVAVVMEKGWEQVAAVLGVLRAGAAYLPIDPAVPARRLALLLRDAQVRIALTQSMIGVRLVWLEGISTVDVDRLSPFDGLIAAQTETSALAYVIYTSGSTGVPKGVMIDHRGAVNTILDMNRRFDVGPRDRVFALSSLSFDLSVYDIFGTLAAGGTIVMPTSGLDPRHWHQLIVAESVTIWNSVPMLMEMLLESAGEATAPESLRLVLLSGDWIGVRLPGRIHGFAPRVRMVSLGGATEASIWSIIFEIGAVDPNWRSIPYGRPLANQCIYVLDSRYEICPPGVSGSIYIGGAGLSMGYWRDPQKTAASFRVHPVTGERIYRTGDLGRYRSDGFVELLGREDAQLKIGGSRVEPGELEAMLESHHAVRTSIVAVRGNGAERRLAAYAVLHPGENATSAELLAFLRERLPQYMLPSALMILDHMPLNANGKVDVKALAGTVEPPLSSTSETPGSSIEAVIASVMAEVLETPAVDCRRNFFDLGATSLLLVRARRLIEERVGCSLPMVDLFRYPTAFALAEHLDSSRPATDAGEDGRSRAEIRRIAAQRRHHAAGEA